jgi:hypothetical protein
VKYITILFLSLNLTAFGQQAVTISGEAYLASGTPQTVHVLSPLKNPAGDKFVSLAEIPVELNNLFHYKLKIDKPQLIEVTYVGHVNVLVYAAPGDSIHIKFEQLFKPDVVKTLWATNNYKERAWISGSDPARLTFFQMLKDRTGYLEEPPFSIPNDTANFYSVYKAKAKEVYQTRLKILNDEANIHHFSSDFIAAAENEIKGQYMTNLIFPTFDSKNLKNAPAGYFDEVNNYNLTWDEFRNSRANTIFAYINIKYYNRPVRGQSIDDEFSTVFNNCLNFKDDAVKNYLLTITLSRYLEEVPSNYGTLFNQYEHICTNAEYVKGIRALYKPQSK